MSGSTENISNMSKQTLSDVICKEKTDHTIADSESHILGRGRKCVLMISYCSQRTHSGLDLNIEQKLCRVKQPGTDQYLRAEKSSQAILSQYTDSTFIAVSDFASKTLGGNADLRMSSTDLNGLPKLPEDIAHDNRSLETDFATIVKGFGRITVTNLSEAQVRNLDRPSIFYCDPKNWKAMTTKGADQGDTITKHNVLSKAHEVTTERLYDAMQVTAESSTKLDGVKIFLRQADGSRKQIAGPGSRVARLCNGEPEPEEEGDEDEDMESEKEDDDNVDSDSITGVDGDMNSSGEDNQAMRSGGRDKAAGEEKPLKFDDGGGTFYVTERHTGQQPDDFPVLSMAQIRRLEREIYMYQS
jgi:hypothetical protein